VTVKTSPFCTDFLLWDELACHDKMQTPVPVDHRADPTRIPRLIPAWLAVRALYGLPLTVLSGYRTRAYNRAIGGAKFSQHCESRALDVAPPADIGILEFGDAVIALAKARPELGIRYVCVYHARGFVHWDVRPTLKLVVEHK
jgi:uncharacterized protein YcbK (DUF882 family)